jgi:hypothetical protein
VSIGVAVLIVGVLYLMCAFSGFRKVVFKVAKIAGILAVVAAVGIGAFYGYTYIRDKRAAAKRKAQEDYYIRSYEDGTLIIEHDGRQIAATCRQTLTWNDGTDKLGAPMAGQHECTYLPSMVGQHIRAELMWRQDQELRFLPWTGQNTVQTADVLDITSEAPIGSPVPHSSPKTSPEILRTLQWIQNTLNDDEGATVYLGVNGDGEKRVSLMPDMNGCQVTFVYETQREWKVTYHIMQQVNLSDLDPESVEVNPLTHDSIGPVSNVTLYTTDKAPLVRLTTGDWSWRGLLTVPSTSLIWELPAPFAARFAKALRQAITLCGGKASSF